MNHIFFKTLGLVTVLLSLTACAGMSHREQNTAAGAGIGGAAGAVLGGSPAAAVGGAIIGGVIGNQIKK
jgi:osmotically inducible lipoprotein OsmB